MPILSLRIIKHPRTSRHCEECHKRIEGETIRLYGMAFEGDKPYSIYLHRGCLVSKDALLKLQAAEQQHQADLASPCPFCGLVHKSLTETCLGSQETPSRLS